MSTPTAPPTVTLTTAASSAATNDPNAATNFLHHNSKKSKLDTSVVSTPSCEIDMKEKESATETPKSFKDVLLEAAPEDVFADECWGDLLKPDLPEDKWYKEPEDELNKERKTRQLNPAIPVSNDELRTWSKPWKNPMIVKVLGKKVNFKLLENEIRRSWVKEGTFKITDMGDDFYLVQLSSMEDYRHALFEEPWKVADHCSIVQIWRPFFSLDASISKKVVVWIRIPKLLVELCNEKFLTRASATLGNMLKVDKLTSLHERGNFARICVEFDLGQPLDSHIYVRGRKLFLEYEGLHSICFRCEKYGHKKDNCREMLEVNTESPIVNEESVNTN